MSFRYPPYDLLKNGWFIERKSPPFKKGETLEDQRIGRSILSRSSVVLGVGITASLLAVALKEPMYGHILQLYRSALSRAR